jgi:hypothetical protein
MSAQPGLPETVVGATDAAEATAGIAIHSATTKPTSFPKRPATFFPSLGVGFLPS